MKKTPYIKRHLDSAIDLRSKAFGAICIVGPKGVGKTRTASERCKTIIKFQDPIKGAGYIDAAKIDPYFLSDSLKPMLLDEWKDAPTVWDLVRNYVDENTESGQFYLTASTSKPAGNKHTGTGRISTLALYPLTFAEEGLSSKSISLSRLIEGDDSFFGGQRSSLDLKEILFAACKGGWPRTLMINEDKAKLEVAKDYYNQLISYDVSAFLGRKVNIDLVDTILKSFARNVATTAKQKVILGDAIAATGYSVPTILSIIEALKQLYVVTDIPAWSPQIRSKTGIRGAKKHIFVDPSLAIAVLKLSPSYFHTDMDTFGHIFENLVLRDLLSYASAEGATLRHYRDDFGLEVDAVYERNDGSYALIEIKTGMNRLDEGEKNLIRLRDLIIAHNKKKPEVPYRLPSQLIIISGTAELAYTRPSGVKIIPFGCLTN